MAEKSSYIAQKFIDKNVLEMYDTGIQ